MTAALDNSGAKCSTKVRADGSKPCRYGIGVISVESPAIHSGVACHWRATVIIQRREWVQNDLTLGRKFRVPVPALNSRP